MTAVEERPKRLTSGPGTLLVWFYGVMVVGSGPTAQRVSRANALIRLDFPAFTWPTSTIRSGDDASPATASRACAT